MASGALDADVIVVGGGAAGLAAAAALDALSLRVLLLEGRARLGGRVAASASGVDLGAQWIHGADVDGGANPVLQIARAAGLATAPARYHNARAVGADGAEVSDARERAMEAAYRRALRAARSRTEPSLGARFDAALAAGGASAAEASDARHALATYVEGEWGADAAWLDGAAWDEGADVRGGDLILPGGLAAIVPYMRGALGAGVDVRVGARVTRVDYGGVGVRVVVAAAEPGGEERVFAARAAIITLPLGVLKAGLGARSVLPPVANAATVAFSPPLPLAHAAAIDALGFGLLQKFICSFDASVDLSAAAKFDMLEFVSAPGAARPWPEWLVLKHYAPARNVLIAFSAGSEALALSAASDADVAAALAAQLRILLGMPDLPAPSVERTKWEADEFVCGSYSFLAPGAKPAHRAQLAAPFAGGRMVFAGEACEVDYSATVHGAILSGRRAAAAVARALAAGGGAQV
jgi:monoamine oxidase